MKENVLPKTARALPVFKEGRKKLSIKLKMLFFYPQMLIIRICFLPAVNVIYPELLTLLKKLQCKESK